MASKYSQTKNVIGWICAMLGGLGVLQTFRDPTIFHNEAAYIAGRLSFGVILLIVGVVLIAGRKEREKEVEEEKRN